MLAGAKLEEENKLVASWWFRIHLGWGEMGELNVEEQRIKLGRDYSSSVVANSRSSLYLRNMVELVVDFTSSGINSGG